MSTFSQETVAGVAKRKLQRRLNSVPTELPRPGSVNAANTGLQVDASGHFTSTTHTNSDSSGTRV